MKESALGCTGCGDPGRGRLARARNLALLAALFGFSIAVYGRLPERIPVHFDLAGRPDRFEPRSLGAWLLMPVIAVAMAGLFGIIGRLVHRLKSKPELLNVPAKAEFLRLSAEQREPVIAFARAMPRLVLVRDDGPLLLDPGRLVPRRRRRVDAGRARAAARLPGGDPRLPRVRDRAPAAEDPRGRGARSPAAAGGARLSSGHPATSPGEVSLAQRSRRCGLSS